MVPQEMVLKVVLVSRCVVTVVNGVYVIYDTLHLNLYILNIYVF